MADGYGRMADEPTYTHKNLGPGLANGLANLHNVEKRTYTNRKYSGRTRDVSY